MSLEFFYKTEYLYIEQKLQITNPSQYIIIVGKSTTPRGQTVGFRCFCMFSTKYDKRADRN